MKIASQLEQFNHGVCLLIVTGSQDMRVYIAHDGQIERIHSFRIEKPAYSDREGFYGTRAKGVSSAARSGSVLRPVERSIRLEFKREIKTHLKDVGKNYHIAHVVLFTPKRHQSETVELINKDLQQKITTIISGNYFDEKPFDLIKRYSGAIRKPRILPIKESARKILNSAREIMQNPKKRINDARA